MEMNTSFNAQNLRTDIADLKIDVRALIVILKNRTQDTINQPIPSFMVSMAKRILANVTTIFALIETLSDEERKECETDITGCVIEVYQLKEFLQNST